MEERYTRNIPTIQPLEQQLLAEKKVVILGCGGIGGYLVENLVRIGIGELTVVDGDVFQPSNLNRQSLAAAETLGWKKVRAAEAYAEAVNPNVKVRGIPEYFNRTNADQLVARADLVMDALDNIPTRLLLEEVCAAHAVPVLHGTVRGWLAQIAVVPPGSGMLRRLYGESGEQTGGSTIAAVPQLCAAIQTAQAVAFLCGRQVPLWGRLLLINAEDMSWNFVDGNVL